jgi:HEAT repeat protein
MGISGCRGGQQIAWSNAEHAFPEMMPPRYYELRKQHSPEKEEALCRALRDRTRDEWGNRSVAYWTARLLGEIAKERSSLVWLNGATGESADPRVRRAAEEALLKTILRLTERFERDRHFLAGYPASLLSAFGSKVSGLARSDDVEVRCLAIRCLGRIRYVPDIPYVVSSTRREPRRLADAAIDSLIAYSHDPDLRDNEAVRAALLPILDDPEPERRLRVVESIRTWHGRTSYGIHIPTEKLLALLKDEDPRVVARSLRFLRPRKETTSIQPALRLLDHPNSGVRGMAQRLLEETGLVTAQDLSPILKSESPRVRYGALQIARNARRSKRLTRAEKAEFHGLILSLVDDPDERISTIAKWHGGDMDAGRLARMAKQGVKAMIASDDERITPFLLGAIEDGASIHETDLALRFLAKKEPEAAAHFIKERFGAMHDYPRVFELLEDRTFPLLEDVLRTGNIRTRLKAQRMLIQLGDKAVPSLLRLSKSDDALVRAMCEQVLWAYHKDRLPDWLRERGKPDLGRWLIGGRFFEEGVEFSDGRGGRWRLAPRSRYGRPGALWLSHARKDGDWGREYYTGVSAGYGRHNELLMFDMSARAEGDGIILKYKSETSDFREIARQLKFDVADIQNDTDGDGIPDLEEGLLFTNPRNADTDGDGSLDGADPCPTARSPAQLSEIQTIHRAVVGKYFTKSPSHLSVIAVPDVASKQDFGLGDSRVLVLTRSELRTFQEDHGYKGSVLRLSEVFLDRTLGEARVMVTLRAGPRGGSGIGVVLRKVNGLWLATVERVRKMMSKRLPPPSRCALSQPRISISM